MVLIKNSFLRLTTVTLLAIFLTAIIVIVSYGISYDVMYKITASSMSEEETFSEPLEMLRYDIIAESFENNNVFSGPGFYISIDTGPEGLEQIILDKETFVEKSIGKDVYYSEKIIKIYRRYQYVFVQTYWIIEDGFIYVYEKEYTPPEFYHITKEGDNLVYSFFYPVESINCNSVMIAGTIGFFAFAYLLGRGWSYAT